MPIAHGARFAGRTLARRLAVAIPERNAQIDHHSELEEAMSKEEIVQWEKAVLLWESDHANPNPYLIQIKGAQILLTIALY